MPSSSFDEQDALAERNDTLWDLVVQLRDHVEHLRGERAAQAEEIKRLRVALADAAHELKVLRANALSPAEAIQSRRIKPPTGRRSTERNRRPSGNPRRNFDHGR